MDVWYKELDKKFSWSFFGFLVGIIGIVFALYSIIHNEKPNIEFEILTNTDVINVSEDIGKLQILYDNKNVLTVDTTLKILTIKVINNGNVTITKDFFDNNYLPGFTIENGKIAEEPTIIDYNSDYLKKLFSYKYDSTKVTINPIILDTEDFVTLKILVVGAKNEPIKISCFGMIAGQQYFPVKSEIQKDKERTFWARLNDDNIWIKITRFFYYTFSFSLLILVFIMPFSLLSDSIAKKKDNKKIKDFKDLHEVSDDKEYKMVIHIYLNYGIKALEKIIELSEDTERLNNFAHANFYTKNLTFNELNLIGLPLSEELDLATEFRDKSFLDELVIEKDYLVGEIGKKTFKVEFVEKVKRFENYMKK